MRSPNRSWLPVVMKRRSGFTLLELLVAVVMTAVITIAVFGTYRSVLFATNFYGKRIRYQEMAAACIDRMRADLQGLAVRPKEDFAPTTDEASADPLKLFIQPVESVVDGADGKPFLWMTSRSVAALSPQDIPGIADIRYELVPDPNGLWDIRRIQRLLPFAERHEQDGLQEKIHPVLCSAVRSIHVMAIDGKGERKERWDSNASDNRYETPKAVLLRLEVGEAGDRVNVETLVQLPVRRSSGSKEFPKRP